MATKRAVFKVGLAPGKSTPDMPRARVRADGKEVGRKLGSYAVIGITEAKNYDAADFRRGLPRGFVGANLKTECPFWVGPKWKLEEDHIVNLHGGLAHVSPNRVLSCGTIRHKSTGIRVGVIYTHFVSAAWNRSNDPHEAWRQERWNISWKKLVGETHRYTTHGLPVIVAGDMNTGIKKPGSKLRLAPGQVHAYNTGLDHIWLVPAKGVRVKAGKPTKTDLYSDHHLGMFLAGIIK